MNDEYTLFNWVFIEMVLYVEIVGDKGNGIFILGVPKSLIQVVLNDLSGHKLDQKIMELIFRGTVDSEENDEGLNYDS